MDKDNNNGIIQTIGKEPFEWLVGNFNKETRLKDIPEEILDCLCSVQVTLRDYAADRNTIIAIALITFAYKIAGKIQQPRFGSNDILLLKVLAKNERSRRNGESISNNSMWKEPLFELITCEVGDRIRATKFMTTSM